MSSNVKIFTDYTIELIKAALTGQNPPMPPEKFSWEVLYLFAVRHKLVSLIYFALIKLPKEILDSIPNFSDFMKTWKQELFLDANRQTEALSISKALSDNHIDHVFLKGYVTKHLYPDTVMRSMGDMDILYRAHPQTVADSLTKDSGVDSDSTLDIVSLMKNLGYQQINHTPKDDAFFNPLNNTCIELHRTLVDKGYEKEYQYLENIWDKLINKTEYEHMMTKEDFYIYHVIHMAKHIQHSGIGILPFIDLWLYINSNELNWEYLDKEFAILELGSFERYARLLALRWFGNKETSHENVSESIPEDTNKILNLFSNYIFRSGAYGTETQMEINTIANSSNQAGLSALLRRIFPDKTTMINYYGDIIERHPYLIPFYWIYLNINRLFSKDISLKKKRQIISGISEEQIDSTKYLMNHLFNLS